LGEYIVHNFVLNGAVFIELYMIYYASTSKLSVLPRLFTPNFILLYSPHLHKYIAYIFVSNGAVFVELYTIYYASTSKLSILMLFPRYAALPCFFAQFFIPIYSPHLREYFTYSFVLNGAVFIELFTIYDTILDTDK
jgi:hypothetical protein